MAERSAEGEDLGATDASDDGDNENEGAHLLENRSEEEEQQRARDWADNVQLSVQSLHFLLILAQFMFGSFHAVTSLALRMGNDAFVMACIRETVSVPLLVPLALLLEPSWPSFTPHLVARLLVLAFVSLVGVRLLVYVGIFYSSAEISSTLIQSSPIVTMLMCVANGTERLLINHQSGLCKLSSLLCCASATTLMAFWSGPTIISGIDKVGLTQADEEGVGTNSNKPLGIGAIFVNVIFFGIFAIMQKSLLNIYPIVKLQASLAVLGVPMLYALVAPFRPRSAWNLNAWGWLGAAYGGIVSSFIAYLVITMCNRKLDPVSVVSYLPLQPLMASLIGTTLLGDDLHASLVVASVFLLSSVFLLVRGKLCDKRDEQELGAKLPRWRHALQNASCIKMCHCSRINQIRHKDATGVRFHNV